MHDLTGDCIMMRRTSVCLQGLNDASYDDAVLDIGGGGGPAVADRTSRTFLSKNSAKLSAVWSVLPATMHLMWMKFGIEEPTSIPPRQIS